MKKLDKNVVKELIPIWLTSTFVLLLGWNKNPDHWVIFIGPSIAVILFISSLCIQKEQEEKVKFNFSLKKNTILLKENTGKIGE